MSVTKRSTSENFQSEVKRVLSIKESEREFLAYLVSKVGSWDYDLGASARPGPNLCLITPSSPASTGPTSRAAGESSHPDAETELAQEEAKMEVAQAEAKGELPAAKRDLPQANAQGKLPHSHGQG